MLRHTFRAMPVRRAQPLLRLLGAFRFSAMLLSPSLSASGKAAHLWDVPSIPIL
jgi:hypothetical protein